VLTVPPVPVTIALRLVPPEPPAPEPPAPEPPAPKPASVLSFEFDSLLHATAISKLAKIAMVRIVMVPMFLWKG
jgi:hypothetical protein